MEEEEEEEYPYFNGPWLSIIKVVTMFVGELEFSDLPIDLDSDLAPATFSFLVFFVLVMVITLMNLLNGLAVSDVGKLEENAELVSFNSRWDRLNVHFICVVNVFPCRLRTLVYLDKKKAWDEPTR